MTVVGQAPDYNYTTFEVIGSHTFDHVYDYVRRHRAPAPSFCAPNLQGSHLVCVAADVLSRWRAGRVLLRPAMWHYVRSLVLLVLLLVLLLLQSFYLPTFPILHMLYTSPTAGLIKEPYYNIKHGRRCCAAAPRPTPHGTRTSSPPRIAPLPARWPPALSSSPRPRTPASRRLRSRRLAR